MLDTGCRWRDLPEQLGYGSGHTAWRRLREWQAAGVLDRLHQLVLDYTGEVGDDWRIFVTRRQEAELAEIIDAEHLRPEQTSSFIQAAFRDGAITTNGTAIMQILPPVSRFAKDNSLGAKKQRVITKLDAYFERFFSLA